MACARGNLVGLSILVVTLVQQGLIFGADRNVTSQLRGEVVYEGQAQRPKVLRWPNRDVLVGYVGQAEIGGQPTDGWLYDFIGRNLGDLSFVDLGTTLRADLEAAESAGEIPSQLVIHMGGFEQNDDGTWWPRIWFLHNTAGLTETGAYILNEDGFTARKELGQPEYFAGWTSEAIRAHLEENVFSYRQGYDLGRSTSSTMPCGKPCA